MVSGLSIDGGEYNELESNNTCHVSFVIARLMQVLLEQR